MKRTDTRMLFRPLCSDIVALLRGLSAEEWDRPTLARNWRVGDIAAHLLDTALRRLSFQRDRHAPPAPERPIETEHDLARFVNGLNAAWIDAARRLSPRVLTDLYDRAAGDLCDFVERIPDNGAALFPVSWAGEHESEGWLDIGREFTEIWHHGAQIRDAVAAGPFGEPRWLHAVLEIAVRALPYAYRDVARPDGTTLLVEITGPSGGAWALHRAAGAWHIDEAETASWQAAARLSDETAWQLLFNALEPQAAQAAVRVEGDSALAEPLLRTRSVIV
jgi:uncharacterized protein (TIGR03083 family)